MWGLVMSYYERWLDGREKVKIAKEKSLKHLVSDVKELNTLNEKEIEKLNELIELYLHAHDFVTKIGLEISSIADKAKGC